MSKKNDDSLIDLSNLDGDEDSDLKEVGENIGEEFKINHVGSDSSLSAYDEDAETVSDDEDSYDDDNDDEDSEESDAIAKDIDEILAVARESGGGSGGGHGKNKNSAADKVRVKFDKFIQLVATHTYEDILKANADEDVIISTNLLTDLANAHEDSGLSKKLPLMLILGIIIGSAVMFFVLRN